MNLHVFYAETTPEIIKIASNLVKLQFLMHSSVCFLRN